MTSHWWTCILAASRSAGDRTHGGGGESWAASFGRAVTRGWWLSEQSRTLACLPDGPAARVTHEAFPGVETVLLPEAAGSGAAVLLACLRALAGDPEAVMIALPAAAGLSALTLAGAREAALWAERHPQEVVVVGVGARHAEPEHGWLLLRSSGRRADQPRPAHFVPRSSASNGARLHRAGALWSTSAAAFRADTFVRLAGVIAPAWVHLLRRGRHDGSAALVEGAALLPALDLSRGLLANIPNHIHAIVAGATHASARELMALGAAPRRHARPLVDAHGAGRLASVHGAETRRTTCDRC